LLELPALVLAVAALSRHPTTGGFLRWVWSKGIHILGMTALTNLGLLAWWLLTTKYWNRWPELFLASCSLLDLAVFVGSYSSRYIRTVFSEFPKPNDSKG
jgi:hypothetical protein